MDVLLKMNDRRQKSDRRAAPRHPLAGDLAAAIELNAVEVLFQPQYACADNRIVGAEALVRWRHSTQGEIAGDMLFQLAGQAGLYADLSRHVMREAMRLAGDWPEGLRLSVNVTARDLATGDVVSDVEAALAQTGFAPECLTLEITEQALLAELDATAVRLATLAERGIRIALDDFGAGFCNFHYLKVLPLHALKLDRSMVDGICRDPRDLAVLRGIVAMAQALDLAVIAEGIETEAQRKAAADEGCETWQGFLGAKPMGAADFRRAVSPEGEG